MEKTFTLGTVAAMLDVTRSSLFEHVEKGNIPAPKIVKAKRTYYTAAEVEDIKAWWIARGNGGVGVELWTMLEVAELLGTGRSSIQYHAEAGNIPKPTTTRRRGTKTYYTRAEVEGINEFWASRVPAGCSRFSEGEMLEMKAMWEAGVRQEDIAERFGTAQGNVSRYCVGQVLGGWRGGNTARAVRRKQQREKNRRNPSPTSLSA